MSLQGGPTLDNKIVKKGKWVSLIFRLYIVMFDWELNEGYIVWNLLS